jgi:hypothetical protein
MTTRVSILNSPHSISNQCCASGSVGSVPMFLGLPDQDPLSSFLRIRIFPSTSKKERKTLIPTILRLLFNFLSMKTDVNVYSKSNKKKKTSEKTYFLLALCRPLMRNAGSESGSGSVCQCY